MEVEILIEKLAYGGEGLGRIEGKVCLVEGALPGEKVSVKIISNQKKIMRAKLLQILTPSPARENPPCPYGEQCGGCQYQHLSYSEELKWKEIQVREYLTRSLGVAGEIISRIVPSPAPYRYRASLTLHRSKNHRPAFYAKDNRSLLEISDCLIADQKLSEVLKNPPSEMPNDMLIRLDENERIYSSTKDSFFKIKVGKECIHTHTRGFFQNNLAVTALLGERLREEVQVLSPKTFIDLYAGCGAFTFLSAGGVPDLIMLEENPYSLAALNRNLKERALKAFVLEGRAEKIFPTWHFQAKPKDAFLFWDPPRKGMAEDLSEYFGKENSFLGAAYLSCHLGTLARDLGILIKRGKWKIEKVEPFDMFPRTQHIEILVFLKPA